MLISSGPHLVGFNLLNRTLFGMLISSGPHLISFNLLNRTFFCMLISSGPHFIGFNLLNRSFFCMLISSGPHLDSFNRLNRYAKQVWEPHCLNSWYQTIRQSKESGPKLLWRWWLFFTSVQVYNQMGQYWIEARTLFCQLNA